MTLKVLVSAGPTREHLDEVRYFSNASSGRMGYAIAAAARAARAEVVLVSGPTAIAPPRGVTVVPVVSALQMQAALRRRFGWCDVLFMVAAVADYRPATRFAGKLRKSKRALTVRLRSNPDIVAGLTRRKGERVVVGFAMEVQDALAHAREKLARKKLDLLVMNHAAVAGSERTSAVVLAPAGEAFRVRGVAKTVLARRLVRAAFTRLAAARRGAPEARDGNGHGRGAARP